MSTNHNRIKVADLETTDQPNKILITNNAGELEFSNINNIKVDNYNALDYTAEGKALDARQGKILKDLVDNINILLASDNVNLNTIQKLVDAVEVIQTSSNITLVNDLTTGGTTKALTAEMGKTLQNNKVDKVSGERLINAAEINKLSGLSNVTTTIKTILSTVLVTQNVTGFVSYINSLNPVLVVGTNEIVKYTTSDTGRVFQLNLRGRSFGTGQPAITTSDVIEITDFLNKDLKLSNYLSTRNDGQLSTNKVLSTDANGNLKMYSIGAFYPAPFLYELTGNSYLPNNTGNFVLKGAFFTPAMTAEIPGQTVNYITFINDNEIHVNVTTGNIEGNFDVILNNGLSVTFKNRLLIVLGTIIKPVMSDFSVLAGNPNISDIGEFKLNLFNIQCAATFFTIPVGQNFRVYATLAATPLSSTPVNGGPNVETISLISAADNTVKFAMKIYLNGVGLSSNRLDTFQSSTGLGYPNTRGSLIGNSSIRDNPTFFFERIGTEYRIRNSNTNILFTDTFNGDLKIRVDIRYYDIINLKYVELAT
jgi:hypothetical protein